MSQNTDETEKTDDLWLNIARPHYPSCTDQQIQEMKIHHAVDWAFEMDNKKETLYSQYLMMKKLMFD